MNDSVLLNGRYRCVKKIGTGGMSSVFLCHDNRLDKLWAMKISKSDNRHINTKNNEIEVLKSIDFKSFPTIVDAFFHNGQLCIVTEYIEGENLKNIIKKEGRLPYLLALSYFEELVDALLYLHSQSPPILYLDMKPSNIMIRDDGRLFLIDFGIAGRLMCGVSGYGSVGYSPPEQYGDNCQNVDGRADVFALGMTMFELLTGIPPNTDLTIQRQNISKCKFIDKHIKQLILECTNPDISKRSDAASLKRKLDHINRKEKRVKGSLIIVMLTFLVTISVFMSVGKNIFSFLNSHRQEQYVDRMITEASKYMENGKHTRESLNVISGYINGNFIDKEVEADFIYEIAKAYFLDVRDYYLALRYFRRLGIDEKTMEEKYPDAVFYSELCEVLTDFSRDKSSVLEILIRFEEFNNNINDVDIKNENKKVIDLLRMEYGT